MSESFFKEILPIIIWVAIMIVTGRIKKKRQKDQGRKDQGQKDQGQKDQGQKDQGQKSPAPPHPAQRGGVPRRPSPVAASPSPVAPPPTPSLSRIVPTGLAAVIDGVFKGTAWDTALGAQMRSRGVNLRDPPQLLGWVDEVSEAALRQLDDLSSRFNDAVDQASGSGEFNAATIEEFVQRSPQLAVTWSRDVLSDALGLALFGPGFADLREAVERQRPNRDVVQLAVAGDAGAVRMPYAVRRRVLEAGIRLFDMEAGSPGTDAWDTGNTEMVFSLGGLQQIPVPAAPMADATVSLLRKIIRTRIPSLDSRNLLEIFSLHPWRVQMRRHLELAGTVPTGGRIPVAEEELLPALIRLHDNDPGGDWEVRLLSLLDLQKRAGRSRRGSAKRGVRAGRRSRGALVEGLLLTEILGEDLGRPSSRRRAGMPG